MAGKGDKTQSKGKVKSKKSHPPIPVDLAICKEVELVTLDDADTSSSSSSTSEILFPLFEKTKKKQMQLKKQLGSSTDDPNHDKVIDIITLDDSPNNSDSNSSVEVLSVSEASTSTLFADIDSTSKPLALAMSNIVIPLEINNLTPSKIDVDISEASDSDSDDNHSIGVTPTTGRDITDVDVSEASDSDSDDNQTIGVTPTTRRNIRGKDRCHPKAVEMPGFDDTASTSWIYSPPGASKSPSAVNDPSSKMSIIDIPEELNNRSPSKTDVDVNEKRESDDDEVSEQNESDNDDEVSDKRESDDDGEVSGNRESDDDDEVSEKRESDNDDDDRTEVTPTAIEIPILEDSTSSINSPPRALSPVYVASSNSMLTFEASQVIDNNGDSVDCKTEVVSGTEDLDDDQSVPVETASLTVKKRRRRKRGRAKSIPQIIVSAPYKHVYDVEESRGVLYAVAFNWHLVDDTLIFVAVGMNRVSIYECLSDGPMIQVQSYVDGDFTENYFTCAWSYKDDDKTPLIAIAGQKGWVRILSTVTGSCIKALGGHSGPINEIQFHPKDPKLLLSASKDLSVRLWNIKTGVCVVVFSGDGHRDEIITVDFDLFGLKFVSGGIDNSIMVWKLDDPKIQEKIALAEAYEGDSPFETLRVLFPSFMTRAVHTNYVDSAKWLGNFIFSKSCENDLVCWKGGEMDQPWDRVDLSCHEISEIANVKLEGCEGIWFLKLSMDFLQKNMALGCQDGNVLWFDLNVDDPEKLIGVSLKHRRSKSIVRHTAFSRDGKVLICVCDDGTIWRWDREEESI